MHKYSKMLLMWTRGSFLGLFSVESYGLSCHSGMGSPSVDGVKRLFSSLDAAMFISPDAVCCGARCLHVVALYVVLSWWDGYHSAPDNYFLVFSNSVWMNLNLTCHFMVLI